jgi:hypothetical protein
VEAFDVAVDDQRGLSGGLVPQLPERAWRAARGDCEQGARDLLAGAQGAFGRPAVLEARAGRIEHQVIAAADTADLIVLARDEDHAHPGPRSLGPAVRYVVDHAPRAALLIWPDAPSGEQPRHQITPSSPRRKE